MTKAEHDPVDAANAVLSDPDSTIEKLESALRALRAKRTESERLSEALPDEREAILNARAAVAIRTAKLAEIARRQEEAANYLAMVEAAIERLSAAIETRKTASAAAQRQAQAEAVGKRAREFGAVLAAALDQARAVLEPLLPACVEIDEAVRAVNRERDEGEDKIVPVDHYRHPQPQPPREVVEMIRKVWTDKDGHPVESSKARRIEALAGGGGAWKREPGMLRVGESWNDRFALQDWVEVSTVEYFVGHAPRRSVAELLEKLVPLLAEACERPPEPKASDPKFLRYRRPEPKDFAALPREGEGGSVAYPKAAAA